MNSALRALGARARSTGELREKLRQRAAQPEDVDSVLHALKQAGYLDDRRFAENYAAARLENQSLGKLRVLKDLRQRRVAGKLAVEVADATYRDIDEPALIEQFLERKYRGTGAMLGVAAPLLVRYSGKAFLYLVAFNRMKLVRDAARFCGTAGYLLGIPAMPKAPLP